MNVNRFRNLLALSLALVMFGSAAAQNYKNTVLGLSPDHYWQLDETVVGTAVDVVGGLNGTHAGFIDGGILEGQVGAFGPDFDRDGVGTGLPGFGADNKSFGAFDSASIDLGPGAALANSTMTVATWFATAGSQGGDRLWTNNQGDGNTSFQITFGGGFGDTAASIVIGLNPAINGFPATGLPSGDTVGNFHIRDSVVPTKDNQWHHIVASRNGNNIEDVLVVIDGVQYGPDTWSDSTDTWGTTSTDAQIATRTPGDGGASKHALNGRADEVAVWLGRQLTVAESIAIYQSALTDTPMLACDSDADGDCDLVDIDAMYDGFGSAGDFDFDANGTVGPEDIGGWLGAAGITQGDLDLNGDVSSTDLGLLLNNFASTAASAGEGVGYGGGDIDGTGNVDSTDLGILLNNFGPPAAAAAVPEPSTAPFMLVGLLVLFGIKRRR